MTVSSLIVFLIAVDVKAEKLMGAIVNVRGTAIVIRHLDAEKPLSMNQLLHLTGKDKKVIVLRVTYPMQTSSRGVLVSGDASMIREGTPVYDGNAVVKTVLVDNGDGTVTDTSTGLIWMKNANPAAGEKTWGEAQEYCKRLEFANKKEWRLPTKDEFESLVSGAAEEQSWAAYLVENGFSGICESYWTRTEHVNWDNAWYVNMSSNSVYVDFKTNTNHVWPVRNSDDGTSK